ncbi:GNAT family N-acetyltransferase [Streptomyces sp. L2]|uniref:GNAT family N-acetyltransferase n=1 Tax=Streptomyces sp. L2 TaxID=2162665 RepID=UPI0010126C6A|nr:GNAT family N-acetyltransferase [Streptomyces sp. L2]
MDADRPAGPADAPDADDWQLTDDLDDFLGRAGDFLSSRPALHTVPLTVTDALRRRGTGMYGDEPPQYGILGEHTGGVRGVWFRTPPFPVNITPLTAADAEALAAHLAERGLPVPDVMAERDTAEAFAKEWERLTGATAELRERERLYRLTELTPPRPAPEGRPRVAGPADRDLLIRWHTEFKEAAGLRAGQPAEQWADARIAYGGITLWETPDGTPVSMAGATPEIAGQVRLAPVYTLAHLRGRGYAGAVTAAVSAAAVASGVTEVLLFTDLANPTSNALYQRLGYREVADFAVYGFGE